MNLKYRKIKKLVLPIIVVSLYSTSMYAQGPASRAEAKIDQVQSQYGLSGKGVLTIMMDRGIDYRHPDFIDANGNTRIAYIYDLYDDSGANEPDNPFGVGTIYDSNEINASLQNGGTPLVNDLFGHGTATTGIMAGNGSAVTDSELFRGVAYEAKIISIVVTRDYVPAFGNSPGQPGQYNPGILPYAFQFAEQKTAELGLPSVTILNIGSIQDPTDGSIQFCDYVADYVGNGNTFICGVGDDGGKDNHMIEYLSQDQNTAFTIQKGEAGNLRFTAWYPENNQFELTITRPNGQIEGPFAPPTGPTDVSDHFLDKINIYHRGADVEFSNSDSDLRGLLIDFSGETGIYTISLNPIDIPSESRINAFLNPARFSNDNEFLNNENPGGNINPFSACPYSISPGDYVATNKWTDINGIQRIKTQEGDPGEKWIGSSVGPTMDGRLGIDLVAPGEIAWAAYGNDSYYSNFQFNVLEDSEGHYGIQTAVSAAAPLLAGVIALMLEVNPDLSPSEIKAILQESSRQDAFTGAVPNFDYGYGKLDALEAIKKTKLTLDTEEMGSEPFRLTVTPNPVDELAEISFTGSPLSSIPFSLFSVNGNKVMEDIIAPGEKLYLGDLPPGVYFIKATVKELSLVKKIIRQ